MYIVGAIVGIVIGATVGLIVTQLVGGLVSRRSDEKRANESKRRWKIMQEHQTRYKQIKEDEEAEKYIDGKSW